jgi:hypothetical protein
VNGGGFRVARIVASVIAASMVPGTLHDRVVTVEKGDGETETMRRPVFHVQGAHPAALEARARQRRKARQTHPHKRGRP